MTKTRRFEAVLFVMLVLAACGGENNYTPLTAPPAPSPSPQPPMPLPPAGEITGSWTGSYVAVEDGCENSQGTAVASFVQTGAEVSGSLSATSQWCGLSNLQFIGTLEGDRLSGSISGLAPGTKMVGTVWGDKLDLTIVKPVGYLSGELILWR